MRISPDAWALLERAMQGARHASEQSLSDAEALAAVARDALAQQQAEGGADLRRTVVLYECEHCGRTELDTGGQPMDLSAETAARLGCGAQVLDLKQEGQLVQRGGPMPAAVRRAVLLRDRFRCQVPGCQLSRYVDVHHLQQQCQGGVHSRKNCLCLCERHHLMLHEGRLRAEGNADARTDAPDRLQFFHADGEPLVDPWTRLTGAWGAGAEAGAGGKAPSLASPAAPVTDRALSRAPSGPEPYVGQSVDAQSSDLILEQTHSGSQAKPRTPVATPSRDGPDGETHSGSQVEGESACDASSKLSPQAAKLLASMGHRGGWCTESLLRASGLSVPEVADAMLRLELAGRVQRDWAGVYAPLG